MSRGLPSSESVSLLLLLLELLLLELDDPAPSSLGEATFDDTGEEEDDDDALALDAGCTAGSVGLSLSSDDEESALNCLIYLLMTFSRSLVARICSVFDATTLSSLLLLPLLDDDELSDEPLLEPDELEASELLGDLLVIIASLWTSPACSSS